MLFFYDDKKAPTVSSTLSLQQQTGWLALVVFINQSSRTLDTSLHPFLPHPHSPVLNIATGRLIKKKKARVKQTIVLICFIKAKRKIFFVTWAKNVSMLLHNIIARSFLVLHKGKNCILMGNTIFLCAAEKNVLGIITGVLWLWV